MNLLILGGTAFLGRAVAAEALARGHDVACVARGRSGEVPDGARLVVADRDQDDALDEIKQQRWDVVVDVARQPGHVRRAARDLHAAADHAIFISTINVYADTRTRGQDESADLLPPLDDDFYEDMESYGPGKVSCEQAVLDHFGPERTAIVRPGLIGGPGDRSGRSGYWPWRFAHPSSPGGPVLVPAASGIPAQVVDVRDLASWVVDCAERKRTGTFDATGEGTTLAQTLAAAREVAAYDGDVVEADDGWLLEQGVGQWAGPKSLPMWLADPDLMGICDRPAKAARAVGLRCRPLTETFRDVLPYEERRDEQTPRAAGLTDDEERSLLAAYAKA